jgi:hypothetical protein
MGSVAPHQNNSKRERKKSGSFAWMFWTGVFSAIPLPKAAGVRTGFQKVCIVITVIVAKWQDLFFFALVVLWDLPHN